MLWEEAGSSGLGHWDREPKYPAKRLRHDKALSFSLERKGQRWHRMKTVVALEPFSSQLGL